METARFRRSAAITVAVLATTLASTPEFVDAQSYRDASAAGATVGALLGGAVGFFGGAYAGASGDCYELCSGIVFGALGGEMAGVALGAFLGNGGRGNLLADLGVSAAIGTATLLALNESTYDQEGAILIAGTLAQVVGVVMTEVALSPEHALTPMVTPREAGTMGIGLSMAW